ncbi:MAG: GNAT family N-acetyltransferase [Tagaea sp.]|nr:GNAT family N-acetyltransferase [Tagaea sp.]
MRFTGSFQLPGNLGLRLARPDDRDFLLDLFIEARPWLGWVDRDAEFIRFLYEDQNRINNLGAGSVYPEHLDFVIESAGAPCGRMRIDLGYGDWRVTDLQIRLAARGKGVGEGVLRAVQEVAKSRTMPVTLATPSTVGSARGFYERLGFVVREIRHPMIEMIWYPPGHPDAARAGAAAAQAAFSAI